MSVLTRGEWHSTEPGLTSCVDELCTTVKSGLQRLNALREWWPGAKRPAWWCSLRDAHNPIPGCQRAAAADEPSRQRHSSHSYRLHTDGVLVTAQSALSHFLGGEHKACLS